MYSSSSFPKEYVTAIVHNQNQEADIAAIPLCRLTDLMGVSSGYIHSCVYVCACAYVCNSMQFYSIYKFI